MKFITELEQLMFPVFIKCICEKDYKLLLLDGTATEVELWLAWEELLSKFYVETGNKKAVAYVRRLANMEAIHTRIICTSSLLDGIKTAHSVGLTTVVSKLAGCLSEWGYKRQYSPQTIESDIQFIENNIANYSLKLKLAKTEHEGIEKKEAGKENMNPKKYWYRQLHAIEQFKKMSFDTNALNMYRFALYIGELEEYTRSVNTKNKEYNGTGK